MKRPGFLCIIAMLFFHAALTAHPSYCKDVTPDALRKKAHTDYKDGNYKDALEIFQALTLNKQVDPAKVGDDLHMTVSCLQYLNRINEADAFRDKTVKIHEDNWRLLYSAARSWFTGTHSGYIIAGKFHRGHHRGGGRYVNSIERDRVRALQLMEQVLKKIKKKPTKAERSDFYIEFAQMLPGSRGDSESWRLQYLSDLSVLPDYKKGYSYDYSPDTTGAPVTPDNTPIYYLIPKSFHSAKNDGERWRWLLDRAILVNPNSTNRVLSGYADFLHHQFGVQTMADFSSYFSRFDPVKSGKSNTYALHTLSQNETMARLATGIRRFELPGDFNFIKIYKEIAAAGNGYSEEALNKLAQIFENRRQYGNAAIYWKKSIKAFETGQKNYKKNKIDQILGNWGMFEPVMTHPAEKKPAVEYRFRNGDTVELEAHKIHVKKLLDDVKAYLKSDPGQLDRGKLRISSLGYRLVRKNEEKYIGNRIVRWKQKLIPGKMHFDKRTSLIVPLEEAGAYLLTAKMAGGNTSKIIIWIDDTVIVKKMLDETAWFYVADAGTGKPLSKVNLEFFGYRQEKTDWKKMIGRRYHVLTTQFSEYSDKNGQVLPAPDDYDRHYQWVITATTDKGRLAYLGFSGVWYGNYHDHEYNQKKVFIITDRPVYRPDKPVKFKVWMRNAGYDLDDVSSYANQNFAVRINNPKGEKVFDKSLKTDAFGGLESEYYLPDDATPGIYHFNISGYSGGHFRVEEYKKPEFEVTIEAPEEPVMLGEKITARIKADYYFGAPVTSAKVKYKILRSEYSADWYPPGTWDWFYGPGYWWFTYDYKWYTGWDNWGCSRPCLWWWPKRHTPPEIVAEAEVVIGRDGIVNVEIDTSFTKEVHGNTDHRYEITAEVTDRSRRTIVGKGTILVARKPFKVYAWVDRGHYRTGDVVHADFSARTLDNKPVKGKGLLTLYKISYRDKTPEETIVQKWNISTDDQGRASIQIKASKKGQYRLSYKVTDKKSRTITGGHMFCVRGTGFDGKKYRFNEIELVPDKREYAPGEKVRLMINTDHEKSTVVLFVRPANGVYIKPKVLRLKGKSRIEDIKVTKKDMPNFFIEAFTVHNGRIYSETREIIVPPEKRVLNVDVLPSSKVLKPGEKIKIKVKLTDITGKPYRGSTVMSVYDKSVEYIAGGSNIPEIKSFFWKWRRQHRPVTESSLNRWFVNLVLPGAIAMGSPGIFGHLVADEEEAELCRSGTDQIKKRTMASRPDSFKSKVMKLPMAATPEAMLEKKEAADEVQPAVRKEFADTAFWIASLDTDHEGIAEVEFSMPENLTAWKIRTWAMGHGTTVGEGTAEVVTSRDLLLRLQAPRFFVEKDEVVLSANIHNYLTEKKSVRAVLETEGGCLDITGNASQTMEIAANNEKRVDWRVKVKKEGNAVVRMKALTDTESDAMEMRFPVYVHGMLKTESFCGVIRTDQDSASLEINIPGKRKPEQSKIETRYSPTLAGAMVDALPYLVEYPYGCTEQTLNRFLPTVITYNIINDMGVDLKAIKEKLTNLNAQEIGKDKDRAKQWKRRDRNPVFDEKTVTDMVKKGLKRLTAMQLPDGGWGWFSGWGERSYPHTTAYIIHGLQIAGNNDIAVVPGVLERGITWLENYQTEEVKKLKQADKGEKPWKRYADSLDAFVYMVLADEGQENTDMRDFLFRDRNRYSVYGKTLFGMALYRQKHQKKLNMVLRNIEQYLVEDKENRTAWLNLPNSRYWWYWYGSEFEAHAYYLKLLSVTSPKSKKAAGLVKYLLNNRKHATCWNSTRDTALCIEAMADYLKASGEDQPDMTVRIYMDGIIQKEVRITQENLFTFDNKMILTGNDITSGKHTIEIKRSGTGPVYFNTYLTNFTLEDFITRAGLEIKVDRKYYKLGEVDKTIKVAGSRGQALNHKVEKYKRSELKNLSTVKIGDLVEIELIIRSKNDYEYIIFEDMKPAGFEPVEVRSGYNDNDLGAYMELRDNRVCFFVNSLARGKHSVSYRMRAEIPGRFSALPTRVHAMYAPELKGNSDEIKLLVED